MRALLAAALAAALLALVLLPSAHGLLRVRSFPDAATAGVDMEDGVGLYDASSPPTYCLLALDPSTPAPVEAYYLGLRYWAASAGTTGGASTTVPEPTDCAGMVPGDNVNVRPIELDAGGAFWIDDELGPTQVAGLAVATVTMEYCVGSPSTTLGPAGVVVPPMEAFLGQVVACGGAGSDVLFPNACGFTLASTPGHLVGPVPVFLGDSGCNSLEGSPAGDFVAQRCVKVQLFDLATGLSTWENDSDFFAVAKDGSLVPWVTDMGTAPNAMYPNVSNLEAGSGC